MDPSRVGLVRTTDRKSAMQAGLITGTNQFEFREFPYPTPKPGGVVVEITYCGICGTDVHAYRSGRSYPPAVCGHEWVGVVSAVSRDIRRFSEGDRVVVAVPPACGTCDHCDHGRQDQCRFVRAVATGRDAQAPDHGGFAPAIGVSAERVIPAEAALSDVEAAQVEPTTISVHAVRRSGVGPGDLVVVQGAGPIGLSVLQVAKAHGVDEVLVVEPNEDRRTLARELGADLAITPEAATDIILERTRGTGADAVIECAGLPDTVQTAIGFCRSGGTMCLVGIADGPVSIIPQELIAREVTVVSAVAYLHEEFRIAMEFIADGHVQVHQVHSSTVGLADLPAAIERLAGGSGETKVLVDPAI